MAKSYNQIIKLLRDFSEDHFIIKAFGNGDTWELVETFGQDDAEYPKMWAEDQPNPMAIGKETFRFRMYFINQVATLKEKTDTTLGEDNTNEVKSNMRQCAQDLISFLVQDTDNPEITVGRDFTLNAFTDKFNDKLTGWWFDLDIEQVFRFSSCNLPIT